MLSLPSSWPPYVAVVLCRESIWREKVAMITEEPMRPVTEGLRYNHLTCVNGFVQQKQESRLVKINATLVKRVPRALLAR